MKKALSLLLALVMCLSLCACGNGEQNGETKTPETNILGKWVDISDDVNSIQFNEDKTAVLKTHGGENPVKWKYDAEQACYVLIITDWAENTMEMSFVLETINGVEQFVFDSRTFARKQDSGDKNPQNTTETPNTTDTQTGNSGNLPVYDYTLLHPFLSELYGEWVIDDSLSGTVIPTKITFYEDGTCYAEFPEYAEHQTITLLWGVVPDSVEDWGNLYLRIGTENDIICIFHVFHDIEGRNGHIANHATVGETDSTGCPIDIAIDGLSEDCYTGMWFSMKKTET